MPIMIGQLKDSDVGIWVNYKSSYDREMNFFGEPGRIKGWNDTFVFVVYKCGGQWDRFQDFTGQATNPEDLDFVDSN